MSYVVAQRKREFAIRIALGARAWSIPGAVLRTGLKLVAIGLLGGIAIAALLSRLLESLLFEVSPADVSDAAAVALLAVVAFCACLLPALRATHAAPADALRDE